MTSTPSRPGAATAGSGSPDAESAEPLVVSLDDVSRADAHLVGGKAGPLGELRRLPGVRVPAGFCVTTHAFRLALVEGGLGAADTAGPDAARLRAAIMAVPLPPDLVAAVTAHVRRLGATRAYAVRSSATAEDLPGASFAGLQDTFPGVSGDVEVLTHIRRCWASLFSERAVDYRRRAGVDPSTVAMAVLVQRMVDADAAGVLFTADPVTGHRRVTRIEAIRGSGEAFVAGRVAGEAYVVRDGRLLEAPAGGRALTDAQALALAELGRRIETHFGQPQDIEWCLADGELQVVQSRPITTLFPIPEAEGNRVYLSVGHQQMMTDAMRPLGLSFWQLTTPRPMAEAGGRLFVDVTDQLASPATRSDLLGLMATSDPLMADAVQSVVDRGDFLPEPPEVPPPAPHGAGPAPSYDPEPGLVAQLIAEAEGSIARLREAIARTSGLELVDLILADLPELRRVLFDPRGLRLILAAAAATAWLREHVDVGLGDAGAADILTRSAPGNITAQMGLDLLDVADTIRPHPELVGFLAAKTHGPGFLDDLAALPGGTAARAAIESYLDRYGARCVGEIDLTRPRWREEPQALAPALVANVRNADPGEAARRFERGRAEAAAKAREVLAALGERSGGHEAVEQARRMIEQVRAFSGYREYPKYGMIRRYLVYKEALLHEARRLVAAGILAREDDLYYLRLPELREVIADGAADHALIAERRKDFARYQVLVPPRVLTSEGERLEGRYRREDAPAGSLVGLAVSAGVVQGRARVILDPRDGDLEAGDVLVTRYTDPSWTPSFATIGGLITEVGGLMTHGAVIAREYGLPAVVGVTDATTLIGDGQRVRLDGARGYVELLE